ncbi:hypothetical protein PHAVU_008G169900 [Phaseolus vulgaris]|uniref:Uncharacterized protein n=1 Tax=Phaseolus vulgaris TaxID=3885 RepID=V7B5M0_PHAVU|nr:hypothetical protein PHAVU_008G169900g [Phaseolus vulgaris]ESW13124.1 hypothetical protein PHAVU_008G169900g [Phaseolus vulgaris]
MATPGFGLPEAYVTTKFYKEKMKKSAQENEEKRTQLMKISTIERGSKIDRGSKGKTPSWCFSWVSKHHHKKVSPISDCNHTQPAIL